MQEISSIHKLIQQILWSQELNGHTHFWPPPPKNHQNYFLVFLNLQQHAKNKFIPSIYSWIDRIQSISESHDQAGHTHLWPHTPSIFWSTFNLCKFVSTCKISGYFIDLLWRYGWLKNPGIWLAESILAHI